MPSGRAELTYYIMWQSRLISDSKVSLLSALALIPDL